MYQVQLTFVMCKNWACSKGCEDAELMYFLRLSLTVYLKGELFCHPSISHYDYLVTMPRRASFGEEVKIVILKFLAL